MTESEQNTKAEMSAASLLRLAGVPTISDLRLIEAKVDSLDRKLVALQAKLDKLSLTIGASSPEGFYDRVDFQLGEIKDLLSKVGS